MKHDGGPPWEDEYLDCHKDLLILKKIAVLLDKMLDDKYRYGLPGIARDVTKLEHKLNYMLDRKSRYGLFKIKHDIKQEVIKCAQNMKDFVDKIDKVEDVVKHSAMVINEIKKEVRKIEEVVTDPKFEDIVKHSALLLTDIKKDVKKVQDIVADPKLKDKVKHSALVLNDIKRDVKKVEQIVADPKFEDAVKHSTLLLTEIKKDVKRIEETIADPKFEDTVKHSALLLNDIKKDVKRVEQIVADPKFEDAVKHSTLLLTEIKKDVKRVEETVADPKFEDTVKHSALLLNDIKKDVKRVEQIVADPKFEDIVKHSSMVLGDIKKEIGKVEDIITNPEYGLKELKGRLDNRPVNTLTTGPLFVDFDGPVVTSVHLKAQNYSNETQRVTFVLHKLDDNSPFTTGERVVTLANIPPLSAKFADIPLDEFVQNLEIKAVLSDATNVFVYAAILDISNPSGNFVKKDILHSEWAPIRVTKNHCDNNLEVQPSPLE